MSHYSDNFPDGDMMASDPRSPAYDESRFPDKSEELHDSYFQDLLQSREMLEEAIGECDLTDVNIAAAIESMPESNPFRKAVHDYLHAVVKHKYGV